MRLIYVTLGCESQAGAVVKVRQVGSGGVCLMEDRSRGNSTEMRIGQPWISWNSSSSSPSVEIRSGGFMQDYIGIGVLNKDTAHAAVVSRIPYISGSTQKAWFATDEKGRNFKAQGKE